MNKSSVNVSVFIAVSLDGFIARPDGDVSWLDEFEPLGEGDDAGYSELFNKVDSLVLGRGSFEKVLEFDWPYGTKPVIVLSSSLSEVPGELKGSVRIKNSAPLKLLEKLEAEGCQHIYLDGGQVIQSFLQEGLVSDITLTIIPVLLGQGIPLFGHLEKDIKLKLLESSSWENGFTQSKYKVMN